MVTFLFTDVEGSTKLLHKLGAETYVEVLAEHRRVIRESCARYGGVEVDTQGDAFFFAFGTPRGALLAAGDMTEELASGQVRVRIGLHTGRPLLTEEGYVGDDVHFGARVAASGHGGQVILSKATRDLLDSEFALSELGEHRLKDIEGPIGIFQLGNAKFPPLRTISNTNLPRPASSFVGRERELAEVLGRIDRGARLLTLTGPGGSGKTRLALEASATLVPKYKAGVFWVGLAPLRDPALVVETISQSLGAKDGLAEHIQEREMLILLDNLEQVIEAASELSALLASCPNLTLLITSREVLRVQGEVEYAVPPMAAPEAVSLFCERGQLEPSEEIAELCARLDSLPLAVELAAARVKALSPAQILARVSQRLDLLKAGPDADPRQQTLRATIEWSYELLTDDEKELFRRLSVFAGGCTLESAEEVAAADLDTLQSLVEKSLVRYSNERYWMLDTIRAYALERLEESNQAEELGRRHGEHCLALANDLASEPVTGALIAGLQAEHNNFRSALAWARRSEDGQVSSALCLALEQLWLVGGHLQEGRGWVEDALQRTRDQATPLRAKTLRLASDLFRQAGDYPRTSEVAHESLALFEKLGDRSGVASALHELGELAHMFEEFNEARAWYEKAIAAAGEAGETGVASINNLAEVALAEGNYEAARRLGEEAVSLCRTQSSEYALAVTLHAAGAAALGQGRPDEAVPHLKESLGLCLELNFTEGCAWSLADLAALHVARGDARRATRLLGASEALRECVGAFLEPMQRRLQEEVVGILKIQLDEEDLAGEWDAGRQMSASEAVTEGLAGIDN
jgi:predicted ATPase